jgi:D-threonine aldolase
MNWYTIKDINDIDTPALLIYKDRVKQNIERAISYVQSIEQLRPHVKTHKIKEVTELMMAAGITKFKCATIAEAEMLALCKAKDVLLAYPLIGPKIPRLHGLRAKYPNTTFSCLTDSPEAAKQLSDCFLDTPLSIYIDVNVGMNRTGIDPKKALSLFQYCADLKGINVIGLHAYDGHIHDTDLHLRQQNVYKVAALIGIVQRAVERFSQKKMKIVAGGTPTFALHAARYKDIEVSPGTFVFWDKGYSDMMPDFDFLWAGLLATRVISIINETKLCLDLGHKSVAAENPLPRIHFLNVDNATPIGQSEEHLVVEVPDTEPFKVGDIWYGVPIHICPTVALYDKVQVVEHGRVTKSWRVIARDRMISI